MPDHGGAGEDALEDPGGYAVGGAAAVVFEVELAFEGAVDRFDGLAQRLEELGGWASWTSSRAETSCTSACPSMPGRR